MCHDNYAIKDIYIYIKQTQISLNKMNLNFRFERKIKTC